METETQHGYARDAYSTHVKLYIVRSVIAHNYVIQQKEEEDILIRTQKRKFQSQEQPQKEKKDELITKEV